MNLPGTLEVQASGRIVHRGKTCSSQLTNWKCSPRRVIRGPSGFPRSHTCRRTSATRSPFLNATLRGAVYTEPAHSLTWKKAGHNVAFHADRIAVSNVEDRQEAIEELDGLVKLVNRTWERRDEITPDHTTRQRPTAMAVYKLLPASNCRQCGQPTCWNFALKLVAGQVELAACPPLGEPAYVERLVVLEALLVPMPAIGPVTRA